MTLPETNIVLRSWIIQGPQGPNLIRKRSWKVILGSLLSFWILDMLAYCHGQIVGFREARPVPSHWTGKVFRTCIVQKGMVGWYVLGQFAGRRGSKSCHGSKADGMVNSTLQGTPGWELHILHQLHTGHVVYFAACPCDNCWCADTPSTQRSQFCHFWVVETICCNNMC